MHQYFIRDIRVIAPEEVEQLKNELFNLLIKYSNNGKVFYWFAVQLARKKLNLNPKIFRRIMIELHAEGLWKWDGGKIKLNL